MTYRVELTPQAEADIDRIFVWLSQRSVSGAWRWYESFWEAAERMKRMPLAYPLALEDDEFEFELRQMPFGTRRGRTFRALFIVQPDVLQILCVRGPDQQPIRPEDIEN